MDWFGFVSLKAQGVVAMFYVSSASIKIRRPKRTARGSSQNRSLFSDKVYSLLLNKSGFPLRNEPGFRRHESTVRDGLIEFEERVRETAARTDLQSELRCLLGM